MAITYKPPGTKTWEEKRELAERHAPVLALWPEIPAIPHAGEDVREEHARLRTKRATRVTAGAHVTRDFHPRDVRLILDNAQVWEPTPPLPLVPIWIARAYRDFARFFFWPLLAIVVFALLLVALAQGIPGAARGSLEIGAFTLVAVAYLLTLRSPIVAPVDYWHHLNHIVVGAGVVITWAAAFGTGALWYVAPIIAIPSALIVLASIALGIVKGLGDAILGAIQLARGFALWVVGRRVGGAPPRTIYSHLLHGVKDAHEYSYDSEIFFRHPRDGKPVNHADRAAHWSAYSRILGSKEYPVTYYARVLDPDADGVVAIQYWFCYYYNDWANEHEGDWETAIVLLKAGQPTGAAASQHEGGEYREWEHVERKGERPVLYVSAGSHALYFEPGAYFAERAVAGLRVTSLDAEIFGRELLDYVDFTPISMAEECSVISDAKISLIPESEIKTGLWGHTYHDADCTGGCEYNYEWLNFRGHWGVVALSLTGGFSGPSGPAFTGLTWDNPRMWARTVCRPCRSCKPDNKE